MSESCFLVIWQFHVRPGLEARFQETYGPAGAWAKLFARDTNYLRTELQRDLREPGRYLTFDYWTSETAYDQFHAHFRRDYEAMDRQCEQLTESELLIGRFSLIR